jgi:hypothetical protein
MLSRAGSGAPALDLQTPTLDVQASDVRAPDAMDLETLPATAFTG